MAKASCLVASLVLFAVSLSAETVSFRAEMTTANEVSPPVTGVTASAQATITLNLQRNEAGNIVSGVVTFNVDYSFSTNDGTFDGLHIHQGAAGVNGAIVIDSGLSSAAGIAAQGSGNIFRQVNVTSGPALNALSGILENPANFYVNLHTTQHPGGVVRGQFSALVSGPPAVNQGGVVNNASYNLSGTTVAAGSIAAIFGSNMTDGSSCTPPSCFPSFEGGKLKTTMAGATVTINGTPVPIFYAIPPQLGVQIPAELTGTSASVVVTVGGQSSAPQTISLEPFAPGIFTFSQDGKGAGAITHADGTPLGSQSPAQPNEVVIIYATGLGQVTPAVPTGTLAASVTNTVTTPTVNIDGVPAEVQFSGLSGCCVGLNQLNVKIPASTRSGSDIQVVLTIGGKQSNPVTIAVGEQSSPPPAGDYNY